MVIVDIVGLRTAVLMVTVLSWHTKEKKAEASSWALLLMMMTTVMMVMCFLTKGAYK